MKKSQKLLLAAVILFAAVFGFWFRGWLEDWKIQRQFEQALDSFSADSTDFTLSFTSVYAENLSVRSSQLTYKQKQVVEQYVHSLQFEELSDSTLRGGQISVQYWVSNRFIFDAGEISRLNQIETGRIYHCSCKSNQSDLYEKLYDLLTRLHLEA